MLQKQLLDPFLLQSMSKQRRFLLALTLVNSFSSLSSTSQPSSPHQTSLLKSICLPSSLSFTLIPQCQIVSIYLPFLHSIPFYKLLLTPVPITKTSYLAQLFNISHTVHTFNPRTHMGWVHTQRPFYVVHIIIEHLFHKILTIIVILQLTF